MAIGRIRTRRFAGVPFAAAFVLLLWLTVDGLLPPSALVAALAFGALAVRDWRRRGIDPSVQLAGAGLAAGLLVAAVWLRPLAGVPLPDIGVLGPWTYLATEVVFGAIALALLVRAGRGALRRAVLTVAALYPLAYVWDWYTLEVGVFAIRLRTGVELVGIPLEEHLFMLVVPALVLGFHETLHDWDGD